MQPTPYMTTYCFPCNLWHVHESYPLTCSGCQRVYVVAQSEQDAEKQAREQREMLEEALRMNF